jgi:ferredoxin
MIKGSGSRSDVQIADGPGQAVSFFRDHLDESKIHPFDRAMLDNCFGIICGDFCGKCLHKCPSKKLSTKDLKDYDLSTRYSSINRSPL